MPQLEVTPKPETRDMGTAMTQKTAGDIVTARTLEDAIYEAQQRERRELQKMMETMDGDEFENDLRTSIGEQVPATTMSEAIDIYVNNNLKSWESPCGIYITKHRTN